MFISWWVWLEYLLRMAEISLVPRPDLPEKLPVGAVLKHNSPGKVKLEYVKVL